MFLEFAKAMFFFCNEPTSKRDKKHNENTIKVVHTACTLYSEATGIMWTFFKMGQNAIMYKLLRIGKHKDKTCLFSK